MSRRRPDLWRHVSFASLALRDALGVRPSRNSDDEHLRATMAWLCRAHDVCGGRGVSSGYSWLIGWQEPYPETTGYIIPTFLDCAELTGQPEFVDRARRMAGWEIEIQRPDGGVRGGIGVNDYPIVFNTGQVIQGWVAMHRQDGDPRYLGAARRAADWLISIQDEDGKWSRHEFHDIPHAYQSRVAWPLLELHALTQDHRYRQAAERNVRWILSLGGEEGWIREMAFRRGENPFTHTIAYTLRGLLECARLLDGELAIRVDAVVLNACERILMRYERRKRDPRSSPEYLPGTLDEHFRSIDRYSCLTGNAQLAIVFIRLFEHGGDPRFLNAALKLIDQVKATQSLRAINPAIRGAVGGSYPIWGRYTRFGYPNWAAKFLADALMLARRVLAKLEREAGA